MKKHSILFLILAALILSGCESTKESVSDEVEPVIPEPTTEIEEPEEIIEEPVEEIPEEKEQVLEEYIDTDDVEFIDEVDNTPDEEYLRSIEEISNEEEPVTQEEFTDDKAAILQIIDELSVVMENKDANAWLNYLDPDSKKYYSNPANLRKVQRKLPNKLIQLKTIKDYFENVFIPARQASEVDEIRYISKTEVKAVQVKDDDSTAVYYYFKKIKDKWYVNLPVM